MGQPEGACQIAGRRPDHHAGDIPYQAVSKALHKEAGGQRDEKIAEEITARGPQQLIEACGIAGKDGQAGHAQQDIKQNAQAGLLPAQHAGTQVNHQRGQGDGHRAHRHADGCENGDKRGAQRRLGHKPDRGLLHASSFRASICPICIVFPDCTG